MHPLTVPSAALSHFCQRWLGATPVRLLFETVHLSLVRGVALSDGRTVVLKWRPPAARLIACAQVQRHLWSVGFPCPEPLAGPLPVAGGLLSAEAFVPGGEQLAPQHDRPRLFAGALARLVRSAPPVSALPVLTPILPWVGWDHDEPGLWPTPDDRAVDLNTVAGPAWLDAVGRRVRTRLRHCALPRVIGHADWESQNVRWMGERLHVVHDWDSVVSQPEAAIAGAAAAVFTATGLPLTEPSIVETEAFVRAYAEARGRAWSEEEEAVCWAAGIWVRAFNAKKATLDDDGGGVLDRLAAEVEERLARAGA